MYSNPGYNIRVVRNFLYVIIPRACMETRRETFAGLCRNREQCHVRWSMRAKNRDTTWRRYRDAPVRFRFRSRLTNSSYRNRNKPSLVEIFVAGISPCRVDRKEGGVIFN